MTDDHRQPAETIDADFIPVLRSDLALVELEGEMVLSVPVADDDRMARDLGFDTHWLDPTASVVWRCFDGTVSIEDLAGELTEVFVGDRDEILADLIELARTFGRAGLLQGVRPQPRAPHDLSQQSGFPVGTPASFDGLAQISGRPLGDGTGAKRLVVKWSPGCGFCHQIGADLAALVPALEREGVSLVLVASGSEEDNHALLREAGLMEVTLVRGQFELLEGLGTPTAYLVDGGKTASELAMGAPLVVDLARRATGSADVG